MNELITFVVPIYNAEKYIEKCIDSLINQSIINHKAIIIDDGSTDSTGIIIDSYENKYSELIKVIHQDNKGPGAARNLGVSYVETEFVSFLDGDDWLMPRFVEKIQEHIDQNELRSEIIYTLPIVYDMSDHRFKDWMDKTVFVKIFDYPNIIVNIKTEKKLYELEVSPCRKVFRTDFMKKFSFPEGTKWEDVEPNFQMLWKANRITGIKDVGFIYRINSGKQTTYSGGKDRLQIVTVFSRLINEAYENGIYGYDFSCILRSLLEFVKWSIDFAVPEVRLELCKQLHYLYKSISIKTIKQYFKDLKVYKKDRLLIYVLRSPFYSMVGISQYYEHFRDLVNKFKQFGTEHE